MYAILNSWLMKTLPRFFRLLEGQEQNERIAIILKTFFAFSTFDEWEGKVGAAAKQAGGQAGKTAVDAGEIGPLQIPSLEDEFKFPIGAMVSL